MYFALKGENFNGNQFAEASIQGGCKYAVVDDPDFKLSDSFILVDNAQNALQQLSNFHRNQFDIPVIGITGSNGKTTTKELLSAVLSKKYCVLSTKGNFNNHIGVPLTLLSLNKKHDIAIIEMGANHVGEIAFLCELAEPTCGVVTNIGKAHIGEFGGWENIVKAKSELYEYLKKNLALVFVNSDDDLLMNITQNFRKYTYGHKSPDIKGEILPSAEALKIKLENDEIQTHLFGEYNFSNVMAAIAIGRYFKVNVEDIKSAIECYVPDNNRSQVLKTKRNKLILDAYNANPTSMKAALDHFSKIANGNSMVILGDMFELGDEAVKEHEQIIAELEQKELNGILVGEIFCEVNQSKLPAYKDVDQVIESGILKTKQNATILLKGSRAIHLEKLLEQL